MIYFTDENGNFIYEQDRSLEKVDHIEKCNNSHNKALKTTEVGKKLEYNNWEEDYIRNEKEASLC